MSYKHEKAYALEQKELKQAKQDGKPKVAGSALNSKSVQNEKTTTTTKNTNLPLPPSKQVEKPVILKKDSDLEIGIDGLDTLEGLEGLDLDDKEDVPPEVAPDDEDEELLEIKPMLKSRAMAGGKEKNDRNDLKNKKGTKTSKETDKASSISRNTDRQRLMDVSSVGVTYDEAEDVFSNFDDDLDDKQSVQSEFAPLRALDQVPQPRTAAAK